MPRDDVLERASNEAGLRGECPALFLPGFYMKHWGFRALCDGFECCDCVDDFAAIGLGPVPDEGELAL